MPLNISPCISVVLNCHSHSNTVHYKIPLCGSLLYLVLSVTSRHQPGIIHADTSLLYPAAASPDPISSLTHLGTLLAGHDAPGTGRWDRLAIEATGHRTSVTKRRKCVVWVNATLQFAIGYPKLVSPQKSPHCAVRNERLDVKTREGCESFLRFSLRDLSLILLTGGMRLWRDSV